MTDSLFKKNIIFGAASAIVALLVIGIVFKLIKSDDNLLLIPITIANNIADDHNRTDTLIEIAGKYLDCGEKDIAFKILDDAYHFSAKNNFDFGVSSRSYLFTKIAEKYLEYGYKEKGTEILLNTYNMWNRNDDLSGRTINAMIMYYLNEGIVDKAEEISTDVIKGKGNDFSRDFAICEIVNTYANAGLYKQALTIANYIKSPLFKVQAFDLIAIIYASNQMYDEEFKILGRAHEIASSKSFQNPSYAKSITNSILLNKGIRCIYPIENCDPSAYIQQITDQTSKAKALLEISFIYSETNQIEKSVQYNQMAHKISLDSPTLLTEVAANFIKIGKTDMGKQVLFEAIEMLQKTEDSANRALEMVNILKQYIDADIIIDKQARKMLKKMI